MEFMAIEVLLNVDHTYRHDLESFFYVLVWQCARRGWGEEWPTQSLLTRWYTDSYREIAHAKRGDMGVDGFEDILEEFPPHFDCVKPLCRELRGILFPYRKGLFIGTPKDPEVLYGPIIKAFDKAIDDVKAAEE
jgi:Fungal protein kinase